MMRMFVDFILDFKTVAMCIPVLINSIIVLNFFIAGFSKIILVNVHCLE